MLNSLLGVTRKGGTEILNISLGEALVQVAQISFAGAFALINLAGIAFLGVVGYYLVF